MKCLPHSWVVLAVCCAGCSSHVHNSEDWGDVIANILRNPGVIYAPGFRGDPPSGEYLRFSIHPAPAAQACELYDTGWESDDVLDLLRVTTNQIDSDSYAVVENLQDDVAEPQAYVRLLRIEDGVKTRSLRAVGGTLNVQSIAHSTDDWHAGNVASIHLHVEFPNDPLAVSECAVSGDKQGEVQGQCTCTLASGKTSICSMRSTSNDCCASPPAARSFDADLVATPCAAMCVFTDSSLAIYCQELR